MGGFLDGSVVKNLPAMQERGGCDPWVRKTSWRRKRQPTPIFLPISFHGQRSLVGYSPWGHKESEQMSTHKHTEHQKLLHSCNNQLGDKIRSHVDFDFLGHPRR